MTKTANAENHDTKQRLYDLEERTQTFAKQCRQFSKQLPRTTENIEDRKQLTRASGSIFANYIEANEAVSKKDFFYRICVCRKEAKESRGWLTLCDCGDDYQLNTFRQNLVREGTELMKIFGSIASKG